MKYVMWTEELCHGDGGIDIIGTSTHWRKSPDLRLSFQLKFVTSILQAKLKTSIVCRHKSGDLRQ